MRTGGSSAWRRLIAGLCLVVLGSLPAAPAFPYDFGELGESTQPAEDHRRNLTNEVTTIHSGTWADLEQFEVDPVGGELVWVAVSTRKLHLSKGSEPGLVPGGLTRTVNGEIVTADLYPMPASPDKALLSAVYRSYAGLTSVVFALENQGDQLRLRRIDRKGGVALRPVGKFLHGQSFHSSAFWNGPIHRYSSAEEGYRRAEPVNLPVRKPRLLSTTWLSEDRWALVDPSGDLQLVSPDEVLDTVGGDYGATPTTFASERAMFRRPEKSERYRLPATYLETGNVLAVPRNPEMNGGLMDLFSVNSGDRDTLIRLFEHRRKRLTRIASIGPLEGRIADLHVSLANERQLLWLRMLDDGSYRLEMVDLSK